MSFSHHSPRRRPAIRTSSGRPLAAALALVVAGCGGGAPTQAPTQAQYVARANAVCLAASARTAPLVRRLTAAGSALSSGEAATTRAASGALRELHSSTSAALTKLRALRQPTSGDATIKRFLGSLETIDVALARAATAGSARLDQALAELEAAAPAARQLATAATAYGMRTCATLFAGLGTTAPGSSAQVHATIRGESHHPTVGVHWRYTVTVTDAAGHPLKGTETTHYTFSGAVVGTEKPENVSFADGVYHDTIEFPAAAVGYPLTVQAVVRTSRGTATADWPLVVRPAK